MNNQPISDQWDGTDIEPIYPRYHDSKYLTDTRNRDKLSSDDEYFERYREGDRFS